jgi:hypothetical protein
MRTLTDIFNDYIVNVYPYQENYYDWYRKADNLRSAIQKAFLSQDEQGKVHPHQARVGRNRLAKASEIALARFDALSVSNFANFDSIHQFVKSVGDEIKGFGLLAAYDIALRIAKYQKCDIKEVHIHAGVSDGAHAMGFDVKDGQTITVDEFPAPLNQLSGDHIENLLCIYKEALSDPCAEVSKTCVRLKSKSILQKSNCR